MDDNAKLTEERDKRLRKVAADGGRARAETLEPEKRQEIARQAAAARWGQARVPRLPRAVYGSPDRPLRIGEIEIPCYVLEDGRRVLSKRGMQSGVGMSTSGGTSGAHRMVRFLEALEAKGL